MISARGKVQDAREGLAALRRDAAAGLEPNEITYTAVLNAGEPTLQFFVQLRQQGLQPNVVTFREFLQGC